MRIHRAAAVIAISAIAAAAGWLAVAAAPEGMRGGTPVESTSPAPHPPKLNDEDRRRTRNYPEQPPLIPHSIEGYQIDLRANKCLSCHSRRRTAATGAPMPSVTHFMDRDLQTLSDISPRRYFCLQCHVSQTDSPPPVGNTFRDAADPPTEDGE